MTFLLERFEFYGDRDALVWRDQTISHRQLRERINACEAWLTEHDIPAGAVVLVEADFTPRAVALFFALALRNCIQVPLTTPTPAHTEHCRRISEAEFVVTLDPETEELTHSPTGESASHEHICELRKRGHPGLILFSSGSTGEPKGAVHDLRPIIDRFRNEGKSFRAISFLLFDHIGGVNTMLYMLAHGGCLVTVEKRDPDSVLGAVARHGVELLPASPTFLNLVLVSEAHRRHGLSSLQRITYGTEPMPEGTLRRLHEALPNVRLQQTYGLSEVGILSTRSRSSDSLWMKMGGNGMNTRVVDGLLEIKSETAMLGYLNAPSPFTDDGWFKTGDAVEIEGEYMRILGRRSELINIGGEKVYPAEVEGVIEQLPEVAEATVCGEPNVLTGQAVTAEVVPAQPDVDPKALTRVIRRHCNDQLARYKVPVRIRITDAPLHSARFKKRR